MALSFSSGDLLNITLSFANGTQGIGLNVLHYQVGSVAGPPPTLATAAGVIGDAVFNHYAAAWSATANATCSFNGVKVTSVFPLPRSTGFNFTPGVAAVGAIAGELLPGQNTWTVLKRSLLGTREGLGRAFIVGLSEASQDQGKMIAGIIPACNALATKFGQPIAVAGVGWSTTLNPVIVNGPEDNPTGQQFVVLGELSNDVVKAQRRRRPGKGI